MNSDILNRNNKKRFDGDRRSGRDRRSDLHTRSEEQKFLQGNRRFSVQLEITHNTPADCGDHATDRKVQKQCTDRRSDRGRRSNSDRRSGLDARSEEERFMQGERRSGGDRRAAIDFRYRSFKKARAFVRDLGLRSVREWRDFIKSGMKPDDIPVAPHYVYANDGWVGWSDWLRASAASTYLSQYRSFEKARAFVHDLGLVSDSKWRAYCKSAKKPDDIPANPQSTYAKTGWTSWGDWLGYTRKHEA